MHDLRAAMSASKAVTSGRALRRLERASALIRRYGAPALLLSWVPLLGDAIVAAAGAERMRFVPFSLWSSSDDIANRASRTYFLVPATPR